MNFNPHDYQKTAIEFIKTHDRCALFLDMGLGKTVSTLTALNDLSGRFMSGKVGEKDNSLEWGKRYNVISRKNGKSNFTLRGQIGFYLSLLGDSSKTCGTYHVDR